MVRIPFFPSDSSRSLRESQYSLFAVVRKLIRMRAADKLKEYEGLSARRDLLDRPSGRVFFLRSVKKSLLNGALPSREMAQVKAPTYPRYIQEEIL